jgi:uncharacterized protein involved in oxidation of intracellular sulfur
MKTLIIINEKPGADEKAYNAIRIAGQLQKDNSSNQLFIYLVADGVICALSGIKESQGVLNVEQMFEGVIKNGATVKMCTSCGESRGLKEKKLLAGIEWTNLKTLTDWITESDKVLNF